MIPQISVKDITKKDDHPSKKIVLECPVCRTPLAKIGENQNKALEIHVEGMGMEDSQRRFFGLFDEKGKEISIVRINCSQCMRYYEFSFIWSEIP